LALQHIPTEANPVWKLSAAGSSGNVAILQLSGGRVDHVQTFAIGTGEVVRLAANQQTRHLATIACKRSSDAAACEDSDRYEVTVSQFGDQIDAPPTTIVSLATPDFMGKVPLRAILSPDGQWLAISFKGNLPDKQILLVSLNHPDDRKSINSRLKRVKEIAFSEDSQTFAAGGACCVTETETETGFDQIQLWSVDKSRFTPKETPTPLTLTGLAQGVQDLNFASDEDGRSLLFAGGRFGAVDLWVFDSKGPPRELRVDTHGTSFVTFNRDEWLVAVASSQGVVRLLDISRWPPFELTPPADDPGPPGFLTFAGNGTQLISSADTVDFWDLDPASLQRKACALLRQVDPKGIKGEMPWHQDKECKEGALTPARRSFLERVQDFLMRAWATMGFAGRS
jgi:hypothetical protein